MEAKFPVEQLVIPEKKDEQNQIVYTFEFGANKIPGHQNVVRFYSKQNQESVQEENGEMMVGLPEEIYQRLNEHPINTLSKKIQNKIRDAVLDRWKVRLQKGMRHVLDSLADAPAKEVHGDLRVLVQNYLGPQRTQLRNDVTVIGRLKRFRSEIEKVVGQVETVALFNEYALYTVTSAQQKPLVEVGKSLGKDSSVVNNSDTGTDGDTSIAPVTKEVSQQSQQPKREKFWTDKTRRLLSDLQGQHQAPEIGSFVHLSSDERVQDELTVMRIQEQFAQKALQERSGIDKDKGTLHELLLLQGLSTGWIDGTVTLTTKFDDYTNHTDAVVEFVSEGAPFRFAIDFTSGTDPKGIKRKKANGEMGVEVKYYHSRAEERDLSLRGIPLVVLGVDKTVFTDLVTKAQSKDRSTDRTVRVLLLEQMRVQFGLQIREMAARMAVLVRDQTLTDQRSAEAIGAYTQAFMMDSEGMRPTDVISLLRPVSEEALQQLFPNSREVEKWKQLMAAYPWVIQQARSIESQQWKRSLQEGEKSKTHRTLSLDQLSPSTWLKKLPVWGVFGWS